MPHIVPVLSEHRMDIPAKSSIAASLETMAPCFTSSLLPIAKVVVVTISMIDATKTTTV